MEDNTKNEQSLGEEQMQEVTGGLGVNWYESNEPNKSSRWSDIRRTFLPNTSNQTANPANPADKIKFHQDAIAGLSQQAAYHRDRGNNTYADMLDRGAAGHMSEINRLNGIK